MAQEQSEPAQTSIHRFFGGPPLAVIGRLVLLSILVGVILAAFGLDPWNIIESVRLLVLHIWTMGFDAVRWLWQYFLLGAVIVVPIWLLVRLAKAPRGRLTPACRAAGLSARPKSIGRSRQRRPNPAAVDYSSIGRGPAGPRPIALARRRLVARAAMAPAPPVQREAIRRAFIAVLAVRAIGLELRLRRVAADRR